MYALSSNINEFSMAAEMHVSLLNTAIYRVQVLVLNAFLVSLSYKDFCLYLGPLAFSCQTSALWDDELWKIAELFRFNRAV